MPAVLTLVTGEKIYARDLEPHEVPSGPQGLLEVTDYGSPPPCTCCGPFYREKRDVMVNLDHVVSIAAYREIDE